MKKGTCLFVSIIFFLFAQASLASNFDPEKELQKNLENQKIVIKKAHQKQKKNEDIKSEIARLKQELKNVKATHNQILDKFKTREEELKSLPATIQQRHREMMERYTQTVEEYIGVIEALPTDGNDFQSALETLNNFVEANIHSKRIPIFGNLPYRDLNLPVGEPDTSAIITPAYRGGDRANNPDDLKDTDEAPISEEIATLAQSLNWNPVSIYEYVKNNVETEWYWGCQKGAEETLRQKSGNDCDQATLLTALLRSSGFPSRYVRGVIEFPSLGQVKNLTGIDDPAKIADFFQKAGIPHKAIISAGTIANFQIEHVWIESLIPYSNYRGAVIDNHGKTWLGLDTSIKVTGYNYNAPMDVFQGLSFEGLRDEYLGAVRTETPLEYIRTYVETYLNQNNPGVTYNDVLRTKALIPEVMNILPASMQYDQIAVTHEYTEIPEDLKHKVKFTASDTYNNELFNISIDVLQLSNRKIILSYEPETVEDQQIIDYYGGLDNTPAYLVRLRPVLELDGEMVVAGKDGLPMGTDYNLTVELISPNGTERITSTQITANLSAIGFIAQKALDPEQTIIIEEDGAETILFKETNRYADNWNKSENELASLLQLQLTRPIPTVTTIGGTIDVTYLLDIPHGFEWKGVFIDASLRAIGVTPSRSPLTQGGDQERQKTFMTLSALQGSVLENRIFEDDFQVDSISTAKLFQIVGAIHESPAAILTIDKTNIDALLPTLDLADNIKEDIINAVNQDLVVRIPQLSTPNPQSQTPYKDWTGIAYIKENPTTGEAGYMLSGMIAGGMTAVKKQDWIDQDLANALSLPYSQKVNKDPNSVVRLARLNRTADYQSGIVGAKMKTAYQVIALDSANRPVQGVNITFKVISGGGQVQGEDEKGNVTAALADQVSVITGADGKARARLTLGKYTSSSPYLRQDTDAAGNTYWDQTGLNLVSMSAQAKTGTIETDKPFEAYGKPAEAKEMIKLYPTTDLYGPPSIFASTLWVKVVDVYSNPISDKKVQYKVTREFLGTPPVSGAISAKLFGSISDCPGIATIDCPNAKVADVDPFVKRTEYFGSQPYLILGNTENTKFTITATANKDYFDSKGKRIDNSTALNNIDFKFYTKAVENGYVSVYSAYAIDERGNKIDAGIAGKTFPEPLTATMYYTEKTAERTFKIMPVVKDPPAGSPLKNDAKVEFQVYAGGGSVDPVIQTQDTNGSYSTTLKIGDTPAKNTIYAIGSVTASVPSYDALGNVTRTDKSLSAYFPVEIWGVNITVPAYQMIMVDNEGYLTADVPFKYEILPAEYPQLPEQISLEVYEKDQDGSESLMGFVQADTEGKLVLSMGTAMFDSQKTYYAQVALNRGTKAEIRSDKIMLGRSGLIPDYNRDGLMDDSDRKRAIAGDAFYFWINDDDDEGETGGTDVPGEIHFSDGLLNYENKIVDGVRDLIDFFPVYLDIKNLLSLYSPNEFSYRLVSEDESLNFAYTYMNASGSGEYLTGGTNSLEPALTLGNTVTYKIGANGTLLDPAYLKYINDAVIGQDVGIILIEGLKTSKKPLELQIYASDNRLVLRLQLNLSLSDVEQMFRHKNLTQAANIELVPAAGSTAGEIDRLDAPNCPDVECLGADPQNIKNFVFLHGYNVNGQQARGWHSEMFKRLFWSGSKARFWGVTWYGWDTQIPLIFQTPDFYVNVLHAFNSSKELKNFLNSDLISDGKTILAAHSLGNMVASSAVVEHRAKVDKLFLINAAVPLEAFQYKGNEDDNRDMIPGEAWANVFEPRLRASEWHNLFKGRNPIDYREQLTWRNLFALGSMSSSTFNFYSPDDEVLTGIWQFAEQTKGSWAVLSDYGGWVFNMEDYLSLDIFAHPERANALMDDELRARPLFDKHGRIAELIEPVSSGSENALIYRYEVLAKSFPSTTLATGRSYSNALTEPNNVDMKAGYMTNWPSVRVLANDSRWKHSDIKEVAYPYVYSLYNDFIEKGELK